MSSKFGINQDGRTVGPIDPAKVGDSGWSWFNSEAERDAAAATNAVSLSVRKERARAQARGAFSDALASGFTDDNGIKWTATDDARARVLDLTQRIQEHRENKVASPLPNGKVTVKLRDASNTVHDVSPDQIVRLAELGSDFKDKAEDRLEDLFGAIAAARSHDDLDAVDITAGWPPQE